MKLNASGTEIISVREYFITQFGRLPDIAISPKGKVYLCTDDRGTNQDMIIEVSRGK